MPRIPTSIQRIARRQDRLLGLLLTQCRDLNSAQNELRWLREHAARGEPSILSRKDVVRHAHPTVIPPRNDDAKLSKLEALVKRRVSGEPLQYILGDQPFGDLEILCEPNVLIPRPETETYTTKLAKALEETNVIGDCGNRSSMRQKLRILDLCTGTGAIALLLHQVLRQNFSSKADSPTLKRKIFQSPLALQIVGIDISPSAVNLARKNLEHNLKEQLLDSSAADEVIFREFDVSKLGSPGDGCKSEIANLIGATSWTYGDRWDVIVCNPPYIAPDDYAVGGRTEKSVRNYEPRLALVPPQHDGSPWHPGDTFYPFIIRIARQTAASVVVMEVGDTAQAERVKEQIRGVKLTKVGPPFIETWYDDGSVVTEEEGKERKQPSSARAVVIWRGKWATRRKALWNPRVRRLGSNPSTATLQIEENRQQRWEHPKANEASGVKVKTQEEGETVTKHRPQHWIGKNTKQRTIGTAEVKMKRQDFRKELGKGLARLQRRTHERD